VGRCYSSLPPDRSGISDGVRGISESRSCSFGRIGAPIDRRKCDGPILLQKGKRLREVTSSVEEVIERELQRDRRLLPGAADGGTRSADGPTAGAVQ